MAFRFQRRVRVLPGLYLNFSKSGVSTSARVGNLTVNSRGTATASIPGTGLSYRQHIGNGQTVPVTRTAAGTAVAAKPSAPGTKRIAAGIVCCLVGSVVPVVALAAIPLLACGYEARINHNR